MAWASLVSLEHDDNDRDDLERGMPDGYSAPDYPGGCCFSISAADLAKAGLEDGEPGDVCRFSAMGEVTSIFKALDSCRIELQIGEFAGDDGQFFDLEEPAYISLCQRELEKVGLDADCERGDMLHIVGTARLESSSSTEHGGDTHMLQIVEMSYAEDESQESREHMNG
jgi:hypothetical protein